MTTAQNAAYTAGPEPEKKQFNFANYQVTTAPRKVLVEIPDTGDDFEVTIKELAWSRRNQILSSSLKFDGEGNTTFDGDAYVRSCLKEMIIDAPWGRTNEGFLLSIDARLGAALESLVPKAFESSPVQEIDSLKKE